MIDHVLMRHRRRLTLRDTRADLTPPAPRQFAAFGPNSTLAGPARVSLPDHIRIADDVVIEAGAWLSLAQLPGRAPPRLSIGRGTRIGRFVHIACAGDMVIGEDVRIGARVFVADTYHGYEDVHLPIRDQPLAPPEAVVIGAGAQLGDGAVVLMGVHIGNGAHVAAGSVVTRSVDDGVSVAGNPARPAT